MSRPLQLKSVGCFILAFRMNLLKDAEKFRAPETNINAKNSIRQMLPLGLRESISKGSDMYLYDNVYVISISKIGLVKNPLVKGSDMYLHIS